jgi:hypothetical protein
VIFRENLFHFCNITAEYNIFAFRDNPFLFKPNISFPPDGTPVAL